MVLAAAETSLLQQLDEVADYLVGMNKAEVASEFENGPIYVPIEKKIATSPRDVTEFDTFDDGGYNRESDFQNTQLSKSDIDLTGISSYSAFLAVKVIKTDAVQAGESNCSGEYTFEADRNAKANSSQAKRAEEADSVQRSMFTAKMVEKAGFVHTWASSHAGVSKFQMKQIDDTSWQNATRAPSYLRDTIKIPKCRNIQTEKPSERSSSRDSRSFSRHTVTSSSRRVVMIVLLCAWLISRLILPSLVNDVNMQAETSIIKDTRSEESSTLRASSPLGLEEAIRQSVPDSIAVQQKNNQAALTADKKEQSPQHQSLRNNKMRRHREVKRDELKPKTDV